MTFWLDALEFLTLFGNEFIPDPVRVDAVYIYEQARF